jgi:lysophospholipase L1-like esterase
MKAGLSRNLGSFVASASLLLSVFVYGSNYLPAFARGLFELAIRNFERQDKVSPPPAGATLFVGSSTFTRWKTLESEFKDCHAVNRGFGGSTIPDINRYIDRIVINYKPARIVFYAGTNDIAEGHTAQQVFDDFRSFVEKVHASLPDTQVYFISLSVAPCRLQLSKVFDQGNNLVKAYVVAKNSYLHFIDVTPVMHDKSGALRGEFFGPDNLHMTRAGYDAWMPVLRKALGSQG